MGDDFMAAPAFSLGWLMAQLFDERRLEVDQKVKAPYNPQLQLPLVADLPLPRRRQLALTDLDDLLASVASSVSAQNVKDAGLAENFDEGAFRSTVQELHQAILDGLVGDDQQLSAYQLGLALSDTCWLASATGGPESFMVMFQRGQVASLQTWLASAGSTITPGSATIVGKSLENWQDWIEVNAKTITQAWNSQDQLAEILKALHIQALVWQSVLVGDPQTSGGPTMNAWIQASSAVVRAALRATVSVFRRFWWLIAVIAAVIAGVLVLVIVTLHGASRVWTSLVWVGGTLGSAGLGLRSAVGKAVSGVGSEVWGAARTDATAWNATWLPTLKQTGSQRRSLERAGVATPRMRANLDAVKPPENAGQPAVP
jgi:hypothetical protein